MQGVFHSVCVSPAFLGGPQSSPGYKNSLSLRQKEITKDLVIHADMTKFFLEMEKWKKNFKNLKRKKKTH